MLNISDKLKTFSEALPSIKKFTGKIVVIKYGGSTMVDINLKQRIVEDIILLSYLGIKPVIVHGGGPIIDKWLRKCDISPRFKNGIRITDATTMEIVEMVLVGQINKELVSLINSKGGQAVGLSGKDANLIEAFPLFQHINDFAGQVGNIDVSILNLLLSQGYIPVIASVASDASGLSYNINADIVAGEIAGQLNSYKLILLTDVSGIMYNPSDNKTVLSELTVAKIQQLKNSKVISGGMIPKVDSCVCAVSKGVESAHILDGKVDHILLSIFFN
uniref:Acetylglutamate kinase n=1 Tax=Neogoniolithon spectabile TaxID=231755 RepID=A0A3G3MGP6_9FLOR|nr:acetylglutamate kinase [Neogoniolithon spectabile]AYR06000.1 acetylglutamate kinase [Neogoniolithon spectabile]